MKFVKMACLLASILTSSEAFSKNETYDVVDLGEVRPIAIDSGGNVLEKVLLHSEIRKANGTKMIVGPSYSDPMAMSPSGDVAGIGGTSVLDRRAFVWSSSQQKTMFLDRDRNRYCSGRDGDTSFHLGVRAMLNTNEFTGRLIKNDDAFCTVSAITVFAGKSFELLRLDGSSGKSVLPMAMNSQGQVVGRARLDATNGAAEHAFLFQDGRSTDLGSPNLDSEAFAINSQSVIVGDAGGQIISTYADEEMEGGVAYQWSNGSSKSLGTLGGKESHAYGINDSGIVVGTSDVSMASSETRAFIYDGRTMADLNGLLNDAANIVLTKAVSINNVGQIVAVGLTGSEPHGFLLTPKH